MSRGERLAADAVQALRALRAGVDGAQVALEVILRKMREIAESGDISMVAKFGEISLEYGADIPDAVACLERAVSAGEPGAMRALGHALVNGVGVTKDPARAAVLFHGAADAGDLYAMFNLATLYRTGNGVELDEAASLRFLEEAARGGLPAAMAVLADRLSEADRDEEALAWYVKAAESGLVQAMFAAGSWYRDGFGTRPDPVQALRWFLAMQNQGSRDGTHAAVELAMTMTPEQVRQAARESGREADGEVLVRMLESRGRA
jgi:TPR repeat protein